jgi:hypothetical protein
MNTAAGAIRLNTGMSGRLRSLPAGLLIRTATGFGNIRGDGPGLNMSLGAMLRFTMDAGFMPAASGDGRRGHFTRGLTMLRP